MPSYLQIENISKSYGTKVLFDHIAFNINEGDKIALIAPNGTGKTSLLRILAGQDSSDSGGSILFLRNIRIGFLEQDYDYDPEHTVAQQVFSGDFEQELRVTRILDELGIRPSQKMNELSGGGVKRVAIAQLLAQEADFLIMDEPTNHLDLDGIEYLENYLKRSRCTLFMVTHDRYFLDRVCNTVMEMDRGSIYIYKGDYENFLEKREERIASYNAETERVRNILRRELEWMHATPCARSGKAKYRKQAFWELKDRADQEYVSRQVSLEDFSNAPQTRLGNKIIDCNDLCFSWKEAADDGSADVPIVSHFSYKFQRGERVGIVGPNGAGKSTFLDLLLTSDLASIERGESLSIGYYRQGGLDVDGDETVLDIVPDTHLLNRFLFPHEMLSSRVNSLSGGERRRLYLLTVLMKKPNLLVLDEPTNDLDIVTLNVLEEYLLEFGGTLIIVTHDRHFLDRLVDHLLVFCGDGVIKDFIGGYTEYRSFIKDIESQRRAVMKLEKSVARESVSARESAQPGCSDGLPKKRRLSWKEQREMESLEASISALEAEKAEIEAILSEGNADISEINRASARYSTVRSELDAAEMRWLELSEIA